MRGIFITGTDTGIGKTALAACLLRKYGATKDLLYWKPIQTGITDDDDTRTVRRLSGLPDGNFLDFGIRLKQPLSPHHAAALEKKTLRPGLLFERLRRLKLEDPVFVIEGAGGLLVPLNGRAMMSDFIRRTGLPVVLAARSALGTINHTLLSLEAARARRIPVAGVVMIGPLNPGNKASIEKYGGTKVLEEIPWLESRALRAFSVYAERRFDSRGFLGRLF